MSLRKSLSIREVPQQAAGALSSFLSDVKRAIDALARATLTTDDLVEAGVLQIGQDGTAEPYVPPDESDTITPPAPTALVVTAGVGTLFVEFGGIFFPGFAYVEVLRNTVDVYASAEVVGTALYTFYPDPVGVDSPTYYYWVRSVSKAGVIGQPNSQVGTPATTKLVDTPQMKDLAITNAKIANLAVDNAKIASMAVDKLLAGTVAVGQYIQSQGYVPGSQGWKIHADGTAEFSGVVVRGAIYASQGTIGGSTIGANYMRSTNYVLNTSGWNLQSDGTGQIGGFVIASDHIRSSNYSYLVNGWKLLSNGELEASKITLSGGLIRNAGNTAAIDLNASGNTQYLFRAGNWAPRFCVTPGGGWGLEGAYDVDIRAGGWAYFKRGSISGGALLAGSVDGAPYSIPDMDRPAVYFIGSAPGGGGDGY